MTIIKSLLDEFREAYKSTRLYQYEDFITYTTNRGYAGKGAADANQLIELNKWDLVAIQTSHNTFCVQSSNTEH